ncbi:MAG TPA: amidohydrolase family protein [Pyrinomonadaceae bacterium]|jgi:predicted TIM-barrel fold metal-dependent hydrolase|nr:amidohydrolase family protein [Pyrinomonadaceae bacterium]
MSLPRREWLKTVTTAAFGAASFPQLVDGQMRQNKTNTSQPLALKDYEPKSMLHVPETHVPRSRFPVIDFHTHLSWVDRKGKSDVVRNTASVEEVLKVMDAKNIRIMVNLTGGYGPLLEETIRHWQQPHPDRFIVFTEPWYAKIKMPNYAKFQGEQIEAAKKAGARGLKILKTLGLYLRENVTTGPLVKIDDKRFAEMWDAAGALDMPVAIHVSDPEAFFLPTDRFNERYEELSAHPDWSFHGRDYPSNAELQEARNRVMQRHPRTKFVCLHTADSENLPYVSECLDRYPNMYVDIAARIGELGRQPRMTRKFFDKYQDRILFATDATPHGDDTPQQIFGNELYEIYYRFLETEDEYFDYAPAPIPPQGRWKIYGIGLPEQILKKVYFENAARLLGL